MHLEYPIGYWDPSEMTEMPSPPLTNRPNFPRWSSLVLVDSLSLSSFTVLRPLLNILAMEPSHTGSGAGDPALELRIRSSGPVEDGIRTDSPSDEGAGSSAGSARYRLMSPAKLPISRPAGMKTVPVLSPTSLLESPVLLSNMKVRSPLISLCFSWS